MNPYQGLKLDETLGEFTVNELVATILNPYQGLKRILVKQSLIIKILVATILNPYQGLKQTGPPEAMQAVSPRCNYIESLSGIETGN